MAQRDDDNSYTKAVLGSAKFNSLAKKVDAFEDQSGVYPDKTYLNVASTNLAARGLIRNNLYLGGGDHNLSLDLQEQLNSQYPLNQVRETVSGHVTEIDDTPGAERMLFKHRTGSGVELRADGTVIISATNNTIRITAGDEKVIIEGDGHISYNGNLTMDVTGDFDLKVGGDYNVRVGGDKTEEVIGSSKQRVYRDKETNVHQNKSEYILGVTTETMLSDHNTIVKGNVRNYTEGNAEIFSGGVLTMTASSEVVMSSPNINIGASSLTVIGDSGTIGGENIIGYDYNHYTGHSITAVDTISTNTAIVTERVTTKEFVGSLTGNADTATQAGRAGTAGALGAGGSAGSKVTATPTSVDATATVLPTPTIMTDYLTKSNKGVRQVNIDPSDVMKNQFDKTLDYGGVSNRKLTTAEIRSKMRDVNTTSNEAFIGSQIAEGKLSPTYINSIPPKIGRTVNNEKKPRRGSDRIGPSDGQQARFEV
jgi:hypothetical protein